MKQKYSMYAPTVLRVFLGLLFFIPGVQKLFSPSGIIGMLGGMGFPAATLLGWLVIIAEVLGGLALLLGWRTDLAVWPLGIVMLVALFAVHVPAWMSAQPMALISVLFHLLAVAGLVSVYLSGPGAAALKV